MPKVVKTSDVPADPKRLYIYLYCDKLGCYKSTTKKKAAKSWLSLSESKRRRFLKTCRLRKDLNNTQRVLSTEPFLKQLFSSTAEDISSSNITEDATNKLSLDEINQVSKETCLHGQQNETCLNDGNVPQNETCLDDNNLQHNETCLNEYDVQQHETCLDDNDRQQNEICLNNNDVQQNEKCLDEQRNKTILDEDNERQNSTSLENYNQEEIHSYFSNDEDKNVQSEIMRHVNSICKNINGSDTEDEQEINANNSKSGLFINNIREPIPPPVKNWKELFEALNKDNNITAQDLSASDKRTYVVLLIKIRREYIEKYIEYLESLSNKQLYEHYLKQC